jgi:hypothetical protein
VGKPLIINFFKPNSGFLSVRYRTPAVQGRTNKKPLPQQLPEGAF